MESEANVNITLSGATSNDITILASHHRKMFKEIWEKDGKNLNEGRLDEVEKAYIKKLEEQFTDNTCKAWVVKNQNKIVASGAITICSFVPTPLDLSYKVAFFHSLYTEEKSRNLNCAKIILEKAIRYCKDKGMKRVLLAASDAGRPMYQKIGFKPTSDLMRLYIEEE
jgi:GNAT superfamily N-acetyltransferase